jgi:amino acid adenylation domain-containing protein
MTPEAVALVAGDQELCYAELNRRANQLAHYLHTLGVGPNSRVALCVERSLDMVVGFLGILKAGGAYVPLDPAYPAERLAFLLEDAQAPVLVTQQHLVARLPVRDAHIVCMDADAARLGRHHTSDPVFTASLADLVYVIYTSGSTGRPKGVQIAHGSLLNLILWHQRTFAVTSADRATQLTSPAFDAMGWEVWPYLTAGARVFLADDTVRRQPALLRDWLVKERITLSFVPTNLAESLLTLDWPAETRLRCLLTGADRLQHYPPPTLPFALVNNYGPTEATVLVTSGVVPATAHADAPPPIGRPITNTQVYILDEQLRQVPVGETGELYIGGVGLAVGYLNRPELTAAKFIAHPLSHEPGARLYKTGDLARYLPDGQIAFVGRADDQIKIHGYRIEPSEVVAALHKHPAIHTSCVIAREDAPGEKRLVAYLVLREGAQVAASELRQGLLQTLPDYMVPSVFVALDTLPTTPNGKVDRAALPVPDATNMLLDVVRATPSTPVEKRLATMLSALLNIEHIDIDDNFFLLGGHSLLGAQLVNHVAETFGIVLPLRTLFEAPTVRELAAQIEHHMLAAVEAMSDEEARLLLGAAS